MSRPKYEPGAKTARDQVIESFWALLERKPYEKMGVREIIRAAEVNKNTFYHHFENIDDLAQQAIDEALPKELCKFFLMEGGSARKDALFLMSAPYTAARFDRVKVMLSDNGVALQGRVKLKVIDAWREALGLDAFSEIQRRLALFLAGGIISTLQGRDPREYPSVLSELAGTKPLQAFMEELSSWKS